MSSAPAVFFRFTNTFELATQGVVSDLLLFSRLAGTHLNPRRGQGRLYFLTNGPKAAQSVMRHCNRRAFVVPLPKHFGEFPANSSLQGRPVVYVHLNSRSGPLLAHVHEIISHTKSAHPEARFVLKYTKSVEIGDRATSSGALSVEILPSEQDRDTYLANLARCSVVVLAYQPDLYIRGSSGVFAEAVGLGKPVVVPAGTWMAQEIKERRGVGAAFAEATPRAVAVAVSKTLRSLGPLQVAAMELAPAYRLEHSSRRVLERMLELSRTSFDMAPRYNLGEGVDFSNVYDSRCFMGRGWSIVEPWGVWMESEHAELFLRIDADPNQALVMHARLRPSLGASHDPLTARVGACGQQIAEWAFDRSNCGEWRTALIPPRSPADRNSAICISFSTKTSPTIIPSRAEESSRTRLRELQYLSLRSNVTAR